MGSGISKEDVLRASQKLKLSESETKELLNRFKELGCGNRITREDFNKFVESLTDKSKDKEAWNAVFDMLDLNNDECIDFYEFAVATIYHSKLSKDDKINYLFKMVDFDLDSKITYSELHKAVNAAAKIQLAKRASLTNMKEVFPDLAQGKVQTMSQEDFRAALQQPKGQELLNLMGLL